MLPHCTLRLAFALVVLPASQALADSSINCSGGIVQIGDTKLDLVAKCGKPALDEQIADGRAIIETVDGEPAATASTGAERWTYNFGPAQFLQVVTLQAGRVVAIERGGYGYPPELLRDRGSGRANFRAISVDHFSSVDWITFTASGSGDGKLDLLAKCGGPAAREFRSEKRPRASSRAGTALPSGPALVNVDIELWTYDFGPQQFRSIVTLEDGSVVRVERDNYGTAHP